MKFFLPAVCAVIAVLSIVAVPFVARGDNFCSMKNGPHDLSSSGGSAAFGDSIEHSGLDRLCVYCHTPHNSVTVSQAQAQTGAAGIYVPLWNRPFSTIQYTNTQSNTYTNVILLCLSCHDGSVATNVFGPNQIDPTQKGTGPEQYITSSSSAYIDAGADSATGSANYPYSTSNHPYGFNYIQIQAANPTQFNPPSTVIAGTGGETISDFLGSGGLLTCASCHSVHGCNQDLLIVSDAGSALCLACHIS